MIYIHRFIYVIIFPLLAVIAAIIWLIVFVVATPFYAIIYYILYGKLVTDRQVENMCNCSIYPIFKFLKLIEPK
jgi:hypothetical protein